METGGVVEDQTENSSENYDSTALQQQLKKGHPRALKPRPHNIEMGKRKSPRSKAQGKEANKKQKSDAKSRDEKKKEELIRVIAQDLQLAVEERALDAMDKIEVEIIDAVGKDESPKVVKCVDELSNTLQKSIQESFDGFGQELIDILLSSQNIDDETSEAPSEKDIQTLRKKIWNLQSMKTKMKEQETKLRDEIEAAKKISSKIQPLQDAFTAGKIKEVVQESKAYQKISTQLVEAIKLKM